jgi:hypothetical protein
MIDSFHSAIYDVIREPNVDEAKTITLKRLKAKIIQLKSTYYTALQVDVGESDRLRGEGPSLHHLLQGRKKQKQRTIHQVYDQNGSIQKTTVDLLRLFADHMRQMYDNIPTSAESTRRILECGIKLISGGANAALEEPITLDELYCAIKQGKTNKVPGRDGICLEFYNHTWETIKQDMVDIMNDMYKDGKITDQQKYGIIVCTPKQGHHTRLEDY